MSYDYLASPYSHSDPRVMAERYRAVMKCVAWFLEGGISVYSPIVHFHELALTYNLPKDVNFWLPHNYAMLRPAKSLIIFTLPGWEDSHGIKLETNFAHDNSIPISFIHPNAIAERTDQWTTQPSSSPSSSSASSS